MSNTFGNIFRLTTFGESHGPGVGGVVDGFPAGIDIDLDFIQHELDRRRPGQSRITTPRKEADKVELLSGVFEGKSTGCPIGFLVRNTNQHSNDYDNIRNLYRPSHADFTYTQKYGLRDHTGGGRSSARETIARCVGGALAKLALKQIGVEIYAYTSQVGILLWNTIIRITTRHKSKRTMYVARMRKKPLPWKASFRKSKQREILSEVSSRG